MGFPKPDVPEVKEGNKFSMGLDMQAGWLRRRLSLVRVPTSADCHLSRLHAADFPIARSFLEKMAKYKREHAEEIETFWNEKDS